MKITMIGNYISHHQIPFSNAIYEKIGQDYCFIQTEPMEEERVQMGWGLNESELPYVRLLYQEEEACKRLIHDSDILLVGWMEREDLIKDRLDSNRLTIRISERLYREGQYKAVSPRGLLRKYQEHTKYRNSNVYLLCAGGYVPSDFHIVRAYPDKMFRFGYFPATRTYQPGELFEKKPALDRIELVWAGRFMPLKHPEFVLQLAESLKQKKYDFHIHMIGAGELEQEMKQRIIDQRLEDEITLYGFLKPDEVRDIMEKCHIHLFTSNYLEGWGAVVNEGMNSGLCEVVNSEVGCAPFLICDGENGLLYKEGSYEDFEACVTWLFTHKDEIVRMGKNAYQTIVTEWNAKHAADELFRFYEGFMAGHIELPDSGPFSRAAVISPGKMYESIKGTKRKY